MNLSAVNKTLTLVGRLFDPRHATEAFLPQVSDKPECPPAAPPFFPRVTPEEVGVSSRAVAAMLNELYDDPTLNMHSVLLARNGRVFCEASFGAQDTKTWKYTFSACKSVTSLAVGILMGQGRLTAEEKLTDLFSDRLGPVARLRLASVTVGDLLTMRSGIVFNEAESMTETDWIRCWLNSAVSGEIGKTFNYNSMNSYMLAAVVTRKSGMSLQAFLDRYLFGPMDIRNRYWETCPRGIEKGGWGLYLFPEDMLKLAVLVLNDGVWQGKQLVPARYLNAARTAQTPTPASCGNYDYGFQMWVGKSVPSFLFNGMFGQDTFGYLKTGIAASVNAGNNELFQQSSVYGILDRYLGLPSDTVTGDGSALPPDADGMRLMQTALCRLRGIEPPPAPAEEKNAEGQPEQTPSAPEPAVSPLRSFFSRLFGLTQPQPPVPTASAAPVPTAPPTPPRHVMPEKASILLNRTFLPDPDEPSASVGLLPIVLQVMQSNYTRGFVSLSFAAQETEEGSRLLLTYREADGVFIFPVPVCGEPAVRTQLYFHGEPFLIAAAGTFTQDEDGCDVFRLHCDFPETPCTRILKLFFRRDGSVLFRQDELPGAPLVLRTVIDGKAEIEAQPVIGAALEKIDNDYLGYRVRRTFAPELLLHTEPSAAHPQTAHSASPLPASGSTAGAVPQHPTSGAGRNET